MTERMRDVDHTHPHTNDTFGTVFTRGQAVAADGGDPASERHASPEDTETMADVDHAGNDGVSRAYERGTEGRDETV